MVHKVETSTGMTFDYRIVPIEKHILQKEAGLAGWQETSIGVCE